MIYLYYIFLYNIFLVNRKKIKKIIYFMYLDKNLVFIFYDIICKVFWVVNLKNGYG